MKLFLFLVISTVMLFAMSQKPLSKKVSSTQKIDDWEYNATIPSDDNLQKHSRIMPNVTRGAMPSPMLKSMAVHTESNLGFAVGGAKDADNFYQNITNQYLPKLKSITYEGVFYDHFFDTGKDGNTCENLFCPSYTTATTQNLFSAKKEYYLSVGLNSNIKAKDFQRKKLNLVVVLDISGSMSSAFNQYYYNQKRPSKKYKQEDTEQTKMQIANTSLVNMTKHLHPEDSLGIVLFDNDAYLAKPLRQIQYTDMEAIKQHILALKARGGTNWSAGYKEGLKLFSHLAQTQKDPSLYENRIIFITDAMPNRGELRQEGLFGMVNEASQKGIYTSFIGVGIDFNTDLVEQVSKTKGANYYAVHSIKDFKKRLDDEFDFMVTPLVFDLKLSLQSEGYSIEAVYGSPQANKASNTLMYVNTLFPSASSQNQSKGSIILVKLKKEKDVKDLQLIASYKDREGKKYQSHTAVSIDQSLHFDNTGIQKGILLSEYVTLIQNWLIDTRKGCSDKTDQDITMPMQRCMLYPPERPEIQYMKTWERKSCPLKVSAGYQNIFTLFARKFSEQMKLLNDPSLQKELDTLHTLTKTTLTESKKKDDWQTER